MQALPRLAASGAAGLDLDEDQGLAVEGDEVELAEARPVVAGEDLEAEALEVLGGESPRRRRVPDVVMAATLCASLNESHLCADVCATVPIDARQGGQWSAGDHRVMARLELTPPRGCGRNPRRTAIRGTHDSRAAHRYSASCWYAIDWNDIRCSGETPSLCDRGAVLGRRVADVGAELPARVALLHPLHEAVAGDLGDHRRRRDRRARSRRRRRRGAARSPSAGTGNPSERQIPPATPTRRRVSDERRQVRLVQAALVDPAHAARRDRDAGRGPQHARVQHLAHLQRVLLGVVERAQRAAVRQARASRSRTAPRRRPAARPGSRGRPRRHRPRTGTPSARSNRKRRLAGGALRGGRCASAASRSRRLGR